MKNQESGRSLIELVGIMAIAGIFMVGVIAMYNMLRNRQLRVMATTKMEQIVRDVNLLMGPRGNFSGLSVQRLIEAGALRNDRSPMGYGEWSIGPGLGSDYYNINLYNISRANCYYFASAKFRWAAAVLVNGRSHNPYNYCVGGANNTVSFVIR